MRGGSSAIDWYPLLWGSFMEPKGAQSSILHLSDQETETLGGEALALRGAGVQ